MPTGRVYQFFLHDNLWLWGETIPLTHSRDIAAGLRATVPPSSLQWVRSPVACCTEVIETAPKCRSVSAPSHRAVTKRADFRQVDNPAGAQGLEGWLSPAENERLPAEIRWSGAALVLRSIVTVKVGIWAIAARIQTRACGTQHFASHL